MLSEYCVEYPLLKEAANLTGIVETQNVHEVDVARGLAEIIV